MPSIIKRAKQYYEKKKAEKKLYGKVDADAKQIQEAARYEAYKEERLKAAVEEGTSAGKAKARGAPSGKVVALRKGVVSGLDDLSQGSARALKSGMFDIGGGDIFKGLESATVGMEMGEGTLKNIEVITGVSKRKPKRLEGTGKGGTNISINIGGTTRRKGQAREKKTKKEKDWQENLSELTGF